MPTFDDAFEIFADQRGFVVHVENGQVAVSLLQRG